MEAIADTLQDVRDLLKTSIRSEERIASLQQDGRDQEKRLRRLEQTQATNQWLERLTWIGITAIITGIITNSFLGG
ncbi:hypothetical protein LJC23_07190 [Desulfovibrio sp. OttesenSCG-928-I05]|nr:hypothetical protein [Desulfovibrio sp. OttesenSCG-928-I05]